MASACCEDCGIRLSVGADIKTGPKVAYSEAITRVGRRIFWCRPCTIALYGKNELPKTLAYL